MSQYAEQIGFAAGTLVGTRVDVAGPPVRFGILQDAQLDFSADLKELYGQNRYAIALAPGKTKVEIKAKFAGIRGMLFNGFYFGEAATPATYQLAALPVSSWPMGSVIDWASVRVSAPLVVSTERACTTPSSVAT